MTKNIREIITTTFTEKLFNLVTVVFVNFVIPIVGPNGLVTLINFLYGAPGRT